MWPPETYKLHHSNEDFTSVLFFCCFAYRFKTYINEEIAIIHTRHEIQSAAFKPVHMKSPAFLCLIFSWCVKTETRCVVLNDPNCHFLINYNYYAECKNTVSSFSLLFLSLNSFRKRTVQAGSVNKITINLHTPRYFTFNTRPVWKSWHTWIFILWQKMNMFYVLCAVLSHLKSY